MMRAEAPETKKRGQAEREIPTARTTLLQRLLKRGKAQGRKRVKRGKTFPEAREEKAARDRKPRPERWYGTMCEKVPSREKEQRNPRI